MLLRNMNCWLIDGFCCYISDCLIKAISATMDSFISVCLHCFEIRVPPNGVSGVRLGCLQMGIRSRVRLPPTGVSRVELGCLQMGY